MFNIINFRILAFVQNDPFLDFFFWQRWGQSWRLLHEVLENNPCSLSSVTDYGGKLEEECTKTLICPTSIHTYTNTWGVPWITSALIVLFFFHRQSVILLRLHMLRSARGLMNKAYPPRKVLERRGMVACKSSISLSSELSLSSDNVRCLGYSKGDMIYQGGEWLCEASVRERDRQN